MTRYPTFDRRRLRLRSVAVRGSDLDVAHCAPLVRPAAFYTPPDFPVLVERIRVARRERRPVILMMGAHPIKLGLSRYLIDLLERGWITHLATNGAGVIHDYELAAWGATSENVGKWIREGQFGLWEETSAINDIVAAARDTGEGLAEAVGRAIEEHRLPHRHISLSAAAYRLHVPMTAHVTVGADILHSHANCCGAALGAASYIDFLIFAHAVEHLQRGVYLNLGTSVTGPEVYLKALSMARNVARQRNEEICDFTTAVFDLVPLPHNWRDGEPAKSDPGYYYRPWKTILLRTVADGGDSYYFQGDHRDTLPSLWDGLTRISDEKSP